MMGRDEFKQAELVFINLNDFVPKDHLLRLIHNYVDFSFIYEKVKHLYSHLGRKSIDPVLLMKMLLIGYLYGIPSERKLEEEVRVNLAYRWFLGLGLENEVPDHSTISQNRRRRFKESTIFQDIFDHIVRICMEKGLVTGELVGVDSTHVKAYASVKSKEKVRLVKQPTEYLLEMEKEAQELEKKLEQKRQAKGHKKRGKKRKINTPQEKEVLVSKTDPDAGWMKRPNKPNGFHYLSHTSVDCANGIITDVYVSAGNINDKDPLIPRLRLQKGKFPFAIQNVTADKGYDCAVVHKGLQKLGINGYISVNEIHNSSDQFVYEEEFDRFRCPAGENLEFTTLQWKSKVQKYQKVYAAKTSACSNCSSRPNCFGKTAKFKTLGKPLFHPYLARNRENYKTFQYKKSQRLRRIWCEGTFGTLKDLHNLRRTFKRGIKNVQEQCLFSALALNLKRMVKALTLSENT